MYPVHTIPSSSYWIRSSTFSIYALVFKVSSYLQVFLLTYCIHFFSLACLPRFAPNLSSFHPNYIWGEVQIRNVLIMQSSQVCCFFLRPKFKQDCGQLSSARYSETHPVFLPKCERRFSPIHNRQN